MLATKALGLVLVACSALGLAPSAAGRLGTTDSRSLVANSAQASPLGTTGPPGTGANLKVTKALDAQIRASYYYAYLHDPKPLDLFGVPAGRPESDVRQPYVQPAGVIYGRSAVTNSYWVVADICFNTVTGCEDMGAFQVFHRTGWSGDFAYGTFGICDIPRPLANKWYPGGHYPMGVRCPAAAAAPHRPVLGSTTFIPRIGVGWGTYKPKRIFNGGDPAGLIYGITWTSWGQPDAYGYGTGILGTTELRAFDLGRCTTNGLRAYRFLDVRQPSKSGGKLGGWSSWNDNQTIC